MRVRIKYTSSDPEYPGEYTAWQPISHITIFASKKQALQFIASENILEFPSVKQVWLVNAKDDTFVEWVKE